MAVFNAKEVHFELDGDCISIRQLDFYGPFSRSPNGRFILAWADYDPLSGTGGARETGFGTYLLLEGSNLCLHGRLERPNDGKVSNRGCFVLADWMFRGELGGTFYAFAPSGETLVKKEFSANLFNTGISDDGCFAVCQTCNSDSGDGGILCLFDLERRVLLTNFEPETGWADQYQFDVKNEVLHLIYNDGQIYRYSFSGSFLDADRYGR